MLAVVSDRRVAVEDGTSGNVDYYLADVTTYADYYPFGMMMDGRSDLSSGAHRFGFQGQEMDEEMYNGKTSYAFKYRMNDVRLGRFFAVDPLSHGFPWNSPYSFAENKVIRFIELEGAEIAEPGYVTDYGYVVAIDKVG